MSCVRTCLCHFRSWPEKGESGKGAIDNAPGGLMPGERAVNGRKGKPPMIIAGSRSAENADAAEIKGRDGGKLISGAEIHISAGALGLPSAVGAAPANASGRSGALLIIGRESADFHADARDVPPVQHPARRPGHQPKR
ncbi:MAG: hypothetical protein LBU32_25045, partial [Clostridiales bacterium]|nr:hypothetical protein [Clostridiales bacterium]